LINPAASGSYQLVWIIDSTEPDLGQMGRLLERYGPVVDIAGLDVRAAAELLRREAPIGITTFDEELICSTAALADASGLPYYDLRTTTNLTSKSAQRAALAEAGISVPSYLVAPAGCDVAALGALADEVGFPCVLKPRIGSGSRDTFLIRSASDMDAAVSEVGPTALTGDMVFEGYLADDEDFDDVFAGYLSVECLVFEGEVHAITTTGRFPPVAPFRESGFFIPSTLEGERLREVVDLASISAQALGITDGSLHTEIKLTPDGPRLIEVNGRPGGGIPQMLSSISDIDLFRETLLIAGGDFVPPSQPILDRVAYLFYVHPPVGRAVVSEVRGLDRLTELPGVEDVFLNRPPGTTLDWRDGNHGYLYSVQGIVASHDELRAFSRELSQIVTVDFVRGTVEPLPRI